MKRYITRNIALKLVLDIFVYKKKIYQEEGTTVTDTSILCKRLKHITIERFYQENN